MTSLEESIRRIAPQYQPGPDDLRWFTTELERLADRALPKLIRKRFVETLRAASKSTSGVQRPTATPAVPQKALVTAASTSR
jgi:hypothetical protein